MNHATELAKCCAIVMLATLATVTQPGVAHAADQYEPNGTLSTAWGPLAVGATVESFILPNSVGQGTEEDWYYFRVDKTARLDLTLNVPKAENESGKFDYQLEVFDSKETRLIGSYMDYGLDESISYVFQPGTYYVRVESRGFPGSPNGSATQPYVLRLDTGIAPTADHYEPNNRLTQAWAPLLSGAHVESFILPNSSGQGTEEDWYQFHVAKAGRVDLGLEVPKIENEGGKFDYQLEVFDSKETRLIGSYMDYGVDESISYVFQPGTYYVRVESRGFPGSPNGSATQPYILDLLGPTITLPPHKVGTPVIPRTVRRGARYCVYGYLRSAHANSTRVTLRGYRYERDKWVWRKDFTTTLGGGSRYTAFIAFPSKSRWRVLASVPGDSEHSGAKSGYDYVTVQ